MDLTDQISLRSRLWHNIALTLALVLVLASFLARNSQAILVNLQAVSFVHANAEEVLTGEVHWTLLVSGNESASDLSCDDAELRPEFWCLVLQSRSNSEKPFLTPAANHNASDVLSNYYIGTWHFHEHREEAAGQIWQDIPGVTLFLATQVDKLYQQQELEQAARLGQVVRSMNPEPHPRTADMYLSLCKLYGQLGEFDKAIELCQESEQADSYWLNLVSVGWQYLGLEAYSLVLDLADRLLQSPGLPDAAYRNAHRFRARVHISRDRDYMRALDEYHQLELLGEPDKFTLFEMGELYFVLKDYEVSESILRRVADLDQTGALTARVDALLSAIREIKDN